MTVNSEHNKALSLLGGGEQVTSDLQYIFNAAEAAKARGHEATIEELWLTSISRPLPINVLTPDGMWTREAGILTREVSLDLADIELQRYKNTPLDLLTTRELAMRKGTRQVSPESAKLGISDTFLTLGGVAVLSGNDFALHVAGDIYHTLRQSGR